MGLARYFFSLVMAKRQRQFVHDLAEPHKAQERRLAAILAKLAPTAFGREHHLAEVRGFADFRRRVPIRRYEEFLPWLERMREGETNVLIAEPVQMFALTSGTSGAPKHCPISAGFIREMHASHLIWLHALVSDHPETASGFYLSIVSPAESSRTRAGIPVGAMSGRQLLEQNPFIRRRQAVPYEVCTIKDYAARYHALLVFALARPELRVAMSVNPSTLVLLQQILQQKAEILLEDLAAGQLAGASGLLPEERRALACHLQPRPQRAASLREKMKAAGALLPRHTWPKLALIATWQGGSSPFYLSQLTGIWPDCPRRCLGLRASEGIFSVPLADNTPAGVLAVGGHVLEFLPAASEIKPQAETLLAHELEKGGRYRLIITTSAGFCRYDLADIVEVVGFRQATPEIVFLHKAGNVLSLTGEKVTEDQVVLAMREVERDFREVKGFTVTLELMNPPRYVLAVELAVDCAASAAAPSAVGRWQQILKAFERHLRRLNPEYAEKRASGRLASPRLLILASGTYLAHRAACAAAGRPDGQIKPPHLLPPAGPGPAPAKGCPFFDSARVIAHCASEE